MRDIVEEDVVACFSCGKRMVFGEHNQNGDEIMCDEHYAADYESDQKAAALMLWQMRKTQGAAS